MSGISYCMYSVPDLCSDTKDPIQSHFFGYFCFLQMHFEAAKMLSFTEEEFVKALDWGAP